MTRIRACRRPDRTPCAARRLDVFGSAATERFDPDTSDIDFAVELEPLGGGAYADAFFGLREGLEALFSRPVDLVSLSGEGKLPALRAAVAELLGG